jgi:hypothetical protein
MTPNASYYAWLQGVRRELGEEAFKPWYIQHQKDNWYREAPWIVAWAAVCAHLIGFIAGVHFA